MHLPHMTSTSPGKSLTTAGVALASVSCLLLSSPVPGPLSHSSHPDNDDDIKDDDEE